MSKQKQQYGGQPFPKHAFRYDQSLETIKPDRVMSDMEPGVPRSPVQTLLETMREQVDSLIKEQEELHRRMSQALRFVTAPVATQSDQENEEGDIEKATTCHSPLVEQLMSLNHSLMIGRESVSSMYVILNNLDV